MLKCYRCEKYFEENHLSISKYAHRYKEIVRYYNHVICKKCNMERSRLRRLNLRDPLVKKNRCAPASPKFNANTPRVLEARALKATGMRHIDIAKQMSISIQRLYTLLTGHLAPSKERKLQLRKRRRISYPFGRSIKLALRFQILSRDQFTCRYCGRKPPYVVLHIDHIIPYVEGGTTTPDNLVTSCSDCNCGKSDVILLPAGDLRAVAQDCNSAFEGAKCSTKAKTASTSASRRSSTS